MILLVRHPAVAAGGRCYGRSDLDVADPAAVARLAAEILACATRPIAFGLSSPALAGERDHAKHGGGGAAWTTWTSPARRCRLVAEALGAHHVDDRLQELDFGDWEGRPWDDVPRASLDAWAADPWGFSPPGGESGSALVARVTAFAGVCAEGDHVVITHGGPLKVLTAVLRGEEVRLLSASAPPSSVTIVQCSAPSPLDGEGSYRAWALSRR